MSSATVTVPFAAGAAKNVYTVRMALSIPLLDAALLTGGAIDKLAVTTTAGQSESDSAVVTPNSGAKWTDAGAGDAYTLEVVAGKAHRFRLNVVAIPGSLAASAFFTVSQGKAWLLQL